MFVAFCVRPSKLKYEFSCFVELITFIIKEQNKRIIVKTNDLLFDAFLKIKKNININYFVLFNFLEMQGKGITSFLHLFFVNIIG